MMHRLIRMGIVVSAVGVLFAGHASAGITGVSLAIETTFSTDDSVQFNANYTANAGIDLFITLNGTGNYFIGAPFGGITNSTSSTFPNFYAFLVNAPAGTTFNESSWEGAIFSGGTSINPPFPNASETVFHGPPGIVPNGSTDIGVGFTVSASGPQTLEIILSPLASVPEPSSFTLALIGAIAAGYCARRSRRHR
jgi:hypothetical protein